MFLDIIHLSKNTVRFIQRGPKKCTPSLIVNIFLNQQFGGIDAVSPLMVVTSNTYNVCRSLSPRKNF
jgi:hypothetical protein